MKMHMSCFEIIEMLVSCEKLLNKICTIRQINMRPPLYNEKLYFGAMLDILKATISPNIFAKFKS